MSPYGRDVPTELGPTEVLSHEAMPTKVLGHGGDVAHGVMPHGGDVPTEVMAPSE